MLILSRQHEIQEELVRIIFLIALFLKNTGTCLYIKLIIVSFITVEVKHEVKQPSITCRLNPRKAFYEE